MVLKGCPCVGISLYSLHVPNGFGDRAEFGVNTIHVFPQGTVTAITLVDGGAGDGGSRARTRCEPGLLLCLVATTTYQGLGQVKSCWSRTPFPLSVCSSPSQHWHPHSRESNTQVRGASLGAWHGWDTGCSGLAGVRDLDCF